MDLTDNARIALAAKGAAEHDLADMAVCPPWRHAAFAGLMAIWVGSPAVPLPLRFGLLGAMLLAVVLIIQSDRRRLGVFVNGYRRGKTRRVVVPLMVALATLYSASFYFGDLHGRWGISVALALVALPLGYFGSALWQRVFIRELGR